MSSTTVNSAATSASTQHHLDQQGDHDPEKQDDYDLEKQDDRDLEKEAQKNNETPQRQQSEKENEKDPNVIEFDAPDDPYNPQNMALWKKWVYAAILGSMTLVVTFASSVFSTATMVTADEFGVASEVTTLGTAMFVLGFSFGPVIWGPMSELYGRKVPLFVGYVIFIIFQIPVGVAQNLETILVCRFLAGTAAAAPLAIVGGYLADFFDPVKRGLAVAVFAAATFVGPILGPIVGGFITQSYLGWRWTAWITMIMAGLFGGIGFIVLPETYVPILLHRKAKKIRFETKNWSVRAKIDEAPVNLNDLVSRYLGRPFVMLALEPILLLITLYISFIYGFIYLLFEAYPISFQEERGYSLGVGALPFIAIGVGVLFGSAFVTWSTQTRLKHNFHEHGKIIPEDRLIPMIVGAALLPIGCFWFAWTSSPNISPWPQILAGIPLGAGILMTFLQGLAYLIDVYLMYANSAISANTIVRSLFGAGFPMFATAMYHKLGVDWATSLLGFLALAFFPVPILFYIYGARIRKLSKYAPTT
ncbi:hypothetical protein MMC12_006597 [Toensbergia leucococca]|nr:hypothetical protein [Toensbergia leucococca]